MRRHIRRPRIETITLLVILGLLAGGDVAAHSKDREAELSLKAGGLDGPIQSNGDTILTDASISQGTLKIEAARATVTRKDSEVTRVVLEGKPATLQLENDDGVLMRAQAQRIDYDTDKETVLLTGEVFISQGRDEFRGERVNYDTRNGRITGTGGVGGRIELIIHPKPRTPVN